MIFNLMSPYIIVRQICTLLTESADQLLLNKVLTKLLNKQILYCNSSQYEREYSLAVGQIPRLQNVFLTTDASLHIFICPVAVAWDRL